MYNVTESVRASNSNVAQEYNLKDFVGYSFKSFIFKIYISSKLDLYPRVAVEACRVCYIYYCWFLLQPQQESIKVGLTDNYSYIFD